MTNTLSPQEVGNWQRFLNERGVTDWEKKPLDVDEFFGARSTFATKEWQTSNNLLATGVVGDPEKVLAQTKGFIPFVQAKNFTLLYPKKRTITVITIHTMENPEKPDGAENVAAWFAGKTQYPPPIASAHYCIDQDSVVQCVRDSDIAWHAPGCNSNGIGLEHNGFARQSVSDWFDEPSRKMLELSARLCAKLVNLYGIPIVKLTPMDLFQGASGFCGHADATKAFPGPGRTHTDPGGNFPYAHFLAMVEAYA
jgi:hypothetical protein